MKSELGIRTILTAIIIVTIMTISGIILLQPTDCTFDVNCEVLRNYSSPEEENILQFVEKSNLTELTDFYYLETHAVAEDYPVFMNNETLSYFLQKAESLKGIECADNYNSFMSISWSMSITESPFLYLNFTVINQTLEYLDQFTSFHRKRYPYHHYVDSYSDFDFFGMFYNNTLVNYNNIPHTGFSLSDYNLKWIVFSEYEYDYSFAGVVGNGHSVAQLIYLTEDLDIFCLAYLRYGEWVS